MSPERYFTFVLTPQYVSAAKGLLSDDEQRAVETAILENPDIGVVIPGIGVRKLRIGLSGRGKRGGARVIYFAVKEKGRVYLLRLFQKAMRDDLSARERHDLARLRRTLEDEP